MNKNLPHIGLIGTGTMGSGMVKNLLKAGFPTSIYNRTKSKCDLLIQEGATFIETPKKLAASCDFLITMLSDDEVILSIFNGKKGILAGAHPGLTIIDSSTVHPETSQIIATALAETGTAFLDAPVSGSKQQADEGNLFFIVGGSEENLKKCIPVFEALGKGHIHMGSTGSGASAKLANNMMCAINIAGFAEAMTMTSRYGVSPQTFASFISQSGGASTMSNVCSPRMLESDYTPRFALKLMAKDTRLAHDLAEKHNVPAAMISAAEQQFTKALTESSELDFSAIYQWYTKQNNPSSPNNS